MHTPELFSSIDALLSDEALSDERVLLGNKRFARYICDDSRFLFKRITRFDTYELETNCCHRKEDFPSSFKVAEVEQSCWGTLSDPIPDYDLETVAITSIAVNMALIINFEINYECSPVRTILPVSGAQMLY